MLLHFCPSTGTPKNKSTLRVLPVVPNISDECSVLLQPPSTDILSPLPIFCSFSAETGMMNFIIVLRMRI